MQIDQNLHELNLLVRPTNLIEFHAVKVKVGGEGGHKFQMCVVFLQDTNNRNQKKSKIISCKLSFFTMY